MHTNFVEKLSANVGNLSALTSLDMSENSLLYVAPELGLLSKLQVRESTKFRPVSFRMRSWNFCD
jgi:Leucine-rich repeat (LRR) protein